MLSRVTANVDAEGDGAAGQAFFKAGQIDEARQLHFKLSPLFAALFYETNPIPVKEALGMMGKIDPELRLPLCAMGTDNRNQLARVMKEMRPDLDHPSTESPTSMIKVIVAGAAGRMGCRLVALIKDSTALTLAGAIEGKGHQALGEDAGEIAGCGKVSMPITEDLPALLKQGEVVIDFSAPEATLNHLRTVVQQRRAMVIGTTGFNAPELEELKSMARQVPCVCSPNMSVGVNLIYKVIGEMAKTWETNTTSR